jgi:hypothetical protein
VSRVNRWLLDGIHSFSEISGEAVQAQPLALFGIGTLPARSQMEASLSSAMARVNSAANSLPRRYEN